MYEVLASYKADIAKKLVREARAELYTSLKNELQWYVGAKIKILKNVMGKKVDDALVIFETWKSKVEENIREKDALIEDFKKQLAAFKENLDTNEASLKSSAQPHLQEEVKELKTNVENGLRAWSDVVKQHEENMKWIDVAKKQKLSTIPSAPSIINDTLEEEKSASCEFMGIIVLETDIVGEDTCEEKLFTFLYNARAHHRGPKLSRMFNAAEFSIQKIIDCSFEYLQTHLQQYDEAVIGYNSMTVDGMRYVHPANLDPDKSASRTLNCCLEKCPSNALLVQARCMKHFKKCCLVEFYHGFVCYLYLQTDGESETFQSTTFDSCPLESEEEVDDVEVQFDPKEEQVKVSKETFDTDLTLASLADATIGCKQEITNKEVTLPLNCTPRVSEIFLGRTSIGMEELALATSGFDSEHEIGLLWHGRFWKGLLWRQGGLLCYRGERHGLCGRTQFDRAGLYKLVSSLEVRGARHFPFQFGGYLMEGSRRYVEGPVGRAQQILKKSYKIVNGPGRCINKTLEGAVGWRRSISARVMLRSLDGGCCSDLLYEFGLLVFCLVWRCMTGSGSALVHGGLHPLVLR
ncbi:hypothetical protein L7F22_037367 [Adiantum nelumboides]|nr:hypothetical protein [Adiantum nelumboides]